MSENKPVSMLRRYGTPALVLAAGAMVAELVTGFFSGMGMDLRQVGSSVGGRLKPSIVESVTPPAERPSDKNSCDRQKKDGLEKAEMAVSKADAAFETCMGNARRSWVKRWAPEKYCENDARVRRALEAGREAWRGWKC